MSKLTSKRIESPFAKYNSIGQLTCVICNIVVKSENLWNAHLNSKIHLDSKNKLKSQLTKSTSKEKNADDTVQKNVFKRPASSISQEEEKKIELKKPPINEIVRDSSESDLNAKKQKLDNLVISKKKHVEVIPASPDKMDTSETAEQVNQSEKAELKVNPLLETAASTALPEGFFDDPDMDDKVRGVSRTENLEAEYEEFKKIIQTEEYKSDQIVEKDDILRDVDRDLEEVDELIGRWSKIEDLHNKREAILAANKNKKQENKAKKEESESDESDVDLESVLNIELRNKKRY